MKFLLPVFLFVSAPVSMVMAQTHSANIESCKSGSAEHCFKWGLYLHMSGDVEEGKKHISYACKTGQIKSACKYLQDSQHDEAIVLRYEEEQQKNSLIDIKRCNKGNKSGCLNAARYASSNGKYQEAIHYLKGVCDSEPNEVCNALVGLLVQKGKDDSEKKQGMELAQTICSKGSLKACTFLKELKNRRAVIEDKNSLPGTSCEAGNVSECIRKGAEAHSNGNLEASKKYFSFACGKGEKGTCHAVGVIEETQGNSKEAIKMYRKSSQLNNPMGDFSLGLLLKRTGDIQSAREAFKVGCDAGIQEACQEL